MNMKLRLACRAAAIAVALLTASNEAHAGLRWPPPKFSDAECGTLPDNYKELALAAVKRSLKDPDSAKMRMADMKPVRGAVNANSQWVPGIDVGVLCNAKNSYGGYTGEHLFQVSFYRGKIVNVIDVSALH